MAQQVTPVTEASAANSFFASFFNEAEGKIKVLESTKAQLGSHIAALTKERDGLVAALEAATKALAKTRAQQKSVDDAAAKTRADAHAEAARIVAAAQAQMNKETDAFRARVAAAEAAFADVK